LGTQCNNWDKGKEEKKKLLWGKKKEGKKKEDPSKLIHCCPGIVSKIQTQVARIQMLCETHTS